MLTSTARAAPCSFLRARLPRWGSSSDPVGLHDVNGRWVAVESRGRRANPRIRIFDETLASRVVFEPDETTVDPVPWWASAVLEDTLLVFRQSDRLSVRRFDVTNERWLADWQDVAADHRRRERGVRDGRHVWTRPRRGDEPRR